MEQSSLSNSDIPTNFAHGGRRISLLQHPIFGRIKNLMLPGMFFPCSYYAFLLQSLLTDRSVSKNHSKTSPQISPPEKLGNLNVYGLNGYIACRHFLLKRQARQTGNCVDLTDHSGKIR